MRIQSTVFLPSDLDISSTSAGIVVLPVLLPMLVRKIVERNERSWDLFIKRYGLEGHRVYTLEDLGVAYKISRERVRQLETISLQNIFRFLEKGKLHGRPEVLNPFFGAEIKEMEAFLCNIGFPLSDDMIWSHLSDRYNLLIGAETRIYFKFLFTFLEIFSCESSLHNGAPTIKLWVRNEEQKIRSFAALDVTTRILRDRSESETAFDLLIAVNRELKSSKVSLLSESDLIYLLSMNPLIESNEKEYRIPFDYLPSNELRAERVLRDSAKNGSAFMSTSAILKEINSHRAKAGKEAANFQAVSQSCTTSPAIMKIGGTGEWMLREFAEEGGVETRDIHLLMEEALRVFDSPANPVEIHAYVCSKREVKLTTVRSLLDQHPDKFIRVESGGWAMRDWDLQPISSQGREKAWTDFDAAVRRIFSDLKVDSLMQTDLVPRLTKILGYEDYTVCRRLQKTPYLRLEKNGKFICVHMEEDEHQEETRKKQKFMRETTGKRGHVQQIVRRILSGIEQREMKTVLLVAEVESETHYKRGVIYNSISNMSDVEKFGADRETSCRLIEFPLV